MQTSESTAGTISSPLAQRLAMAACLGIVGYFLWFLYDGAVNIPHQDGIYDFLQFVVNVESADSARSALAEWFRHYNDHRTNASRLQVYLAYLVQGEVNFHTLTLLANLSLLLILAAFYAVLRDQPHRWLVLLAAAGLLLTPRVFTIVLWSQPVFAYCYVFAFAFASLVTLHKVTVPRLLLAAVFCTLASWTFAAAQALWVFGLASLIHQSLFNDRRPWLFPCAWLFIAVAMLLLWRYGYTTIEMHDFSEVDPDQLAAFFPGALVNPTWQEAGLRFASFFVVMLGAAFSPDSAAVAGWIGAAMLSLLAVMTLTGWKRPDVRLLLCNWYVVASAAAVTYGRALVATPDYSLDTRYAFLSVLFASSLVVLVLSRIRPQRTWIPVGTVALALMYCLWSYSRFTQPLAVVMDKRYQAFNKGHYIVFGAAMKDTNAVVHKAIELGIYHPPCTPQPQCERD